MPTMVFDEIDSGIGGLTLNSVADKLSELSENRQMVVITHWPQLAARAERHFFVEKQTDGKTTTTVCTMLDKEQVTSELTRMSGGRASP